MDVVYITRTEVPSNAAQALQIQAMARAFHEQLGDNFLLISSKGGASTSSTFRWQRIRGFRNTLLRYIQFVFKTILIAIKSDNTIFYTRDIALAFSAILCGRIAIYEAHKQPASQAASLLFSWLSRQKNFRLVTISSALADHYFECFPKIRNRTLVAHDGVFPEDYITLNGEKKASLRLKLNLPLEKVLVIHTGSLYKGGAELYEYVAKAGGDKILFVHIGGSRSEQDSWKAYYANLGLANIVFLPQMPPDAAKQYQMAADLLFYVTTRASPLFWCTSPLKLFEYMATGIPILGARIGSVSEIINDSNAFCFDPDHPDTIAPAFLRFLNNPSSAKNIASRAKSDATNEFSWQSRAKRIIEFSRKTIQ